MIVKEYITLSPHTGDQCYVAGEIHDRRNGAQARGRGCDAEALGQARQTEAAVSDHWRASSLGR